MGGGAAESGVEARELEEGAMEGSMEGAMSEDASSEGGCMRNVEGRWWRSSQGLTRESNSCERGVRVPGREAVAK